MTWRLVAMVINVVISAGVYAETQNLMWAGMTCLVLVQLDLIQWKVEDK